MMAAKGMSKRFRYLKMSSDFQVVFFSYTQNISSFSVRKISVNGNIDRPNVEQFSEQY